MIIKQLLPRPAMVEPFRRDRAKFVPVGSGCYVLATATGHILYVGLASQIRSRMLQHLDNPVKTLPTPEGRAMCFHWLLTEQTESVERGWLNMHRVETGRLPILNKVDAPVAC